eukprot:3648183-Rhodomonas_salina.2
MVASLGVNQVSAAARGEGRAEGLLLVGVQSTTNIITVPFRCPYCLCGSNCSTDGNTSSCCKVLSANLGNGTKTLYGKLERKTSWTCVDAPLGDYQSPRPPLPLFLLCSTLRQEESNLAENQWLRGSLEAGAYLFVSDRLTLCQRAVLASADFDSESQNNPEPSVFKF